MYEFFLLVNRQGAVRLKHFFGTVYSDREQQILVREAHRLVSTRPATHASFAVWRDGRGVLVYRRFAALYAIICVERGVDNELLALEFIQRYIEALDSFFGNVCELDIVHNQASASYILLELLCAGEMLEPSNESVIRDINAQDVLAAESRQSGSATATAAAIAGRIAGAVRLPQHQATQIAIPESAWVDHSTSANTGSTPEPAADYSYEERGTASASSKTRFDVEAVVDGKGVKAYLLLTADSLEMRNASTNVVERSWSYRSISRWAAVPTAFAIDLGKKTAANATAFTAFLTPESNSLATAFSKAILKWKQLTP